MQVGTERTLAGRYRLIEAVGRGGMGVVWRAHDSVLKRDVAIKEIELPPTVSQSEAELVQKRLIREARAAAALTHPSVVTVFDIVEDGDATYLVMELVSDPTLSDVVAAEGSLEPARAAAIALQVLDALEVAHARGVIHRDVKPSNILVGEGRARLTDFGVASVSGDPRITASGLVLGSPSYIAPEQALGEGAGPESDLWSLGATIYYAVEAQPPFDKGQPIATMTAALHEDPPAAVHGGPLTGLIQRLLAKDPAARPGIEEVRAELRKVAEGAADTAVAPSVTEPQRIVDLREAEISSADRIQVPDDRPGEAAPPRSRPWMALLALVTIGILAIAAFALADREDSAEAPSDRDAPAAGDAREDEGEKADGAARAGDAAARDLVDYDLPGGYSVSYPSTWSANEGAAGPTTVRFEDPASSSYLLVAWTDTPGPDAYERVAESIEPDFASRYPSYEQVALTPTTFAGTDNAVDWEYRYEADGTELHATNLQFVTGDYGFALNFQTTESDWDSSLGLRDAIFATFAGP